MSDRTALYRHWDADGKLLYVGISLKPFQRLEQHLNGSHWKSQIANVTVEYYEDREQAEAAERQAIKAERPAHNIVHSNDNERGKELKVRRESPRPELPTRAIDEHVRIHAIARGPFGTSPEEALANVMANPIATRCGTRKIHISKETFDASIDRLAAVGRVLRVSGAFYPPTYGDYVHKFVASEYSFDAVENDEDIAA